MKRIILLILVGLFSVSAINHVAAQDEGNFVDELQIVQPERKTYKAVVKSSEAVVCPDLLDLEMESAKECISIDVEIINGSLKGEIKNSVLDTRSDVLAKEWDLKEGDKVVVTEFDFGDESDFQITEIYRANSVMWFVLIYVFLVLFVGRLQGLGSLIGLAISTYVLLRVIIPMTLSGWDPVGVSALGGFAVLLPSIYFSHGFNYKTTIALLGTTLGLIVTGILAYISLGSVNLTGLGAEESLFLINGGSNALDMRGILLASMIIGGIGLIDDVTVGQVAVIREIYEENQRISLTKLYQKAMNVGKDHIASMVNTLFLAYAAASLPLVMVLVDQGAAFGDLVNIEIFAEEIVRTLVASSGLVLTVPITTFLAAYIYTSRNELFARFR